MSTGSGEDRIARAFARARAEGRPALMPFLPVCWPEPDATASIVRAAVEGGADAMELGFPFSDPLADGVTNQRAYEEAIANGATLERLFAITSGLRAEGVSVPFLIMGYFNPLLAYDLGREVEEGATAGLEVEVQVSLGGWLAGAVRPRAQWASSGSGQAVATVHLQSGHLRLLAGNAALTLGRAHTIWGQGQRGGLILSTNPGTLLLARLATEEPVRLPWVLAHLGPSLHQLFLADLGT